VTRLGHCWLLSNEPLNVHVDRLNAIRAPKAAWKPPTTKGMTAMTASRRPRDSFRLSRSAMAALLLGTSLGAGGAVVALSGTGLAAAAPLSVNPVNPQPGFAPLVAKVKAAVVQIATVSRVGTSQGGESQERGEQLQQMPDLPGSFGDMLRQYFGQQPGATGGAGMEQHALGSGFIIDPTGYVVTNNHVVDGAHDVSVTLANGNKYKAKVVGRDAKTDLALLKIEAGHDLPYVAFGDSDKEHEGDWVVAVGNPYGLGGSVTAGIISAHGRNINEGPYDDFLQIDAPINPGNSGGPLFNQAGQVVGIDTAIYSPSGGSVGIGFAIPSNVAKKIVAQLRDHGRVNRGWLGVAMQPLTPALAKAVGLPESHGVLVDTVTDGSPAAQAGLHQGDVITAFGGKPITNSRDLAMAVADTPAGRTATVAVWRDNRSRSLQVTIRAQEQTRVASAAPDAGTKPVGMSLQALTPDARSQLNLDPRVSGVLVDQVTPGSNADESGVHAGDVIERVAGKAVTSPDEVANVIHAAQHEKKEAVSLLVTRDGATSYLGLQLQA
jgi:serine protease Do